MAYTATDVTRSVIGSKRMVTSNGTFTVAGDTWDTGLNHIEAVSVNSDGVNAAGCTFAAGVVTFSGTAGTVSVIVIGY